MNLDAMSQRTLATWALGSLHTGGFMLLLVLLEYRGGGDSFFFGGNDEVVSSLLGLGLYAILWSATWFGTRLGLAESGIPLRANGGAFGRVLAGSIIGGATAGSVFFCMIAGLLALGAGVQAVFDGQAFTVIANGAALFFAVTLFASFFAAIVGAFIGIGVAFVDFTLLMIAAALAGSDEVPSEPAAA